MDVTCIICPNSCRISVSRPEGGGAPVIRGAECSKGISYAIEELDNPVRVLTSTVRVEGGTHRVVPVRTTSPIPKAKIGDCMKYIDSLAVSAPVAAGDVLSGDIAGTGVGMVATWTVQKRGRERE
ncbi:MAG: DUF1667 domain-containing protein [Firmicutes bacterium]|nr:DUF1667 domain-containing protein [Bacillota bacterium]